jgi:flagellar hook-associated protein 1 FlgK
MKVVAEDTVEGAPRKLLQTAGLDLVQQLNTIYEGLIDLQETQNLAVKITVDNINKIAAEIVDLNKAIYGFEVTGSIALDLRDKRNLLLDELSTLVPIEYEEYPDGRGESVLKVKIGGHTLVDHDYASILAYKEIDNVIPGEAKVWKPYWLGDYEPDPGPLTADIPVYLYKGTDRTDVQLHSAINVRSPMLTTEAVTELNALADDFSKLHIGYDDASPDKMDQTSADYADGVKILNRIKALLHDTMDVAVINCEPPGQHAMITVNENVFARSAGCDNSYLSTYKFGCHLPMVRGDDVDLIINSGELKAYLDMRDSADVGTPGIPYYIEMLNDLARALVQEINEVHRQGWTDAPTGSQTGVNFFYQDDDLTNITAKNIRLSDEVKESEFNIACSTKQIVKQGEPNELQSGNNENMNELYKLFLKKDIVIYKTVDGGTQKVDVGSFDGYATSIRFDVANTLNFAKKTGDNYAMLTLAAENQRLSVSGVSLDEEMTNIIKYQNAYGAAARVITAMDEALDKLINGTGRVGL